MKPSGNFSWSTLDRFGFPNGPDTTSDARWPSAVAEASDARRGRERRNTRGGPEAVLWASWVEGWDLTKDTLGYPEI